ncbi:unnamed protein product [Kuraishia capsulata CBS 1993]|uniref:Catechol O-methyltransferase n=1 Tax=Kuraishia capsulata CBS 1993 TaxID=1382522 RepID=W6MWD0_9ASCO|nr:uncharacterized protein KUCA_T00003208001 [Kuraishia capsulata CBS 1993]CDK27230.1 unnamed protein product [Kuraishia capsulata CBS 1993]
MTLLLLKSLDTNLTPQPHQDLLAYLQTREESLKSNRPKILEAIEEFYGPKSEVSRCSRISKEFLDQKSRCCIEIGSDLGYSAVYLIDKALKLDPFIDIDYYLLLEDESHAKIGRYIIELSALDRYVHVIQGPTSKVLAGLGDLILPVDFLYLNNSAGPYVSVIRVAESLGMVGKGTLVAANVGPEVDKYEEYMTWTPAEKRQFIYTNKNVFDVEFPGRWNVVYATQLRESGGHTVALSTCIDFLDS